MSPVAVRAGGARRPTEAPASRVRNANRLEEDRAACGPAPTMAVRPRTKGEEAVVDNLWTIVVMVLVGVPLFLGLRYLATRRAIGQARRRREERGR